MSQVRVKICGITNLDDALAAAQAGADFLGFNFYSASPRYIDPAHCTQISEQLIKRYPLLKRVGVFVNSSAAQIQAILDECHLDLAQLHGDETPEALAALQGRAYKALRRIPGDQLNAFVVNAPAAPALLLDANVSGSFGGTGQTADWTEANRIARSFPIFLAGGLKLENVAQAIAQVHPWGVDTASGVESVPGIKDYLKMQLFINNVHNA